ncbi:hypothetical protein IZY60_04105 [Lutibacter sp. B2]|nr:hypothetical protein [Lutibacter sp. B2]
MILEVKVEKAYNGDCIWLRYGTEDNISNIIIDSGPAVFAKGFKKLMDKIVNSGELIDLLVLTHIDNDHIKGFSKFILNKNCDHIKKVWFNGEGSKIYLENQPHSPESAMKLTDYMKGKGLKVTTPVHMGYEDSINDAKIKVITPTLESIQRVSKEIDKEIDKCTPHSPKELHIEKDIDIVIKDDEYKKDKSITNRASISFVFSYDGVNIAFLGDVHAEDVIYGKNKYFKNKEIHVIKVAHHGSEYNTNKELLQCMKASEFIISKKGAISKRTIARIVENVDNPIINCNYNWWSQTGYFTKNDVEKYIDTGKLKIKEIKDKIVIDTSKFKIKEATK